MLYEHPVQKTFPTLAGYEGKSPGLWEYATMHETVLQLPQQEASSLVVLCKKETPWTVWFFFFKLSNLKLQCLTVGSHITVSVSQACASRVRLHVVRLSAGEEQQLNLTLPVQKDISKLAFLHIWRKHTLLHTMSDQWLPDSDFRELYLWHPTVPNEFYHSPPQNPVNYCPQDEMLSLRSERGHGIHQTSPL